MIINSAEPTQYIARAKLTLGPVELFCQLDTRIFYQTRQQGVTVNSVTLSVCEHHTTGRITAISYQYHDLIKISSYCDKVFLEDETILLPIEGLYSFIV